MPQTPDDALLARIEARATDIARGAGEILAQHFGKPLDVEYKDEKEQDPVTAADRESQEFLTQSIAGHYPNHGVLAEEDEQEEDDSPAQDFVWALDPLDGTRNFLSGLPLYACSVGLMYRGEPMVGAVYVPWPAHQGGVVFHARKGGGAFMEQEPVSVFGSDEPRGNALVALPGSFGATYRFRKPMRGKVGEVRVTGSIAYELAMTACGVLQYSVIAAPRLWDVAGGATLVTEAGGVAMRGQRRSGLRALLTPSARWERAESLVSSWRSGETTMKELRQWSAPIVLGSPGVVGYVTSNMRTRLLLRHRLARMAGPLMRQRRARRASGD